jgi:uncharacterized damage-inducible protein DinB
MAVDHARMDAAHGVARATLESGRQTFLDNVTGISLEEALDAGGGFRSILGLTKHTAAWTAVYLDEARPVYWGDVWPLRQIVAYTATHWAYHAGEINVIIANRRRPPDPTVSTHRFRQTRALSAYTWRPATQNPRCTTQAARMNQRGSTGGARSRSVDI